MINLPIIPSSLAFTLGRELTHTDLPPVLLFLHSNTHHPGHWNRFKTQQVQIQRLAKGFQWDSERLDSSTATSPSGLQGKSPHATSGLNVEILIQHKHMQYFYPKAWGISELIIQHCVTCWKRFIYFFF